MITLLSALASLLSFRVRGRAALEPQAQWTRRGRQQPHWSLMASPEADRLLATTQFRGVIGGGNVG